MSLAGQTAVVTGAAQGIGRAVARRLGEEGAAVVLADVQGETVAETAAALAADGVETEAVECDVSEAADAEALATATRERFGGADVLVNNAGIGTGGEFLDIDRSDWQRVLDVNLTGAYNCSQAIAPGMVERGGGRIVNVSSMAGRNVSYHGAANYTASKWGVIGLTKHMALDLAEHDVRVNALCPGATLTPLIERATTEEGRARTAEGIPLGRWSTPEDQADAAYWLVSEESSYVTGTVLEVDGGSQLAIR